MPQKGDTDKTAANNQDSRNPMDESQQTSSGLDQSSAIPPGQMSDLAPEMDEDEVMQDILEAIREIREEERRKKQSR